MARKKYSTADGKKLEWQIQLDCVHLLQRCGLPAIRQNAGLIKLPGGGYINLAPKGAADISTIIPDGSGRRLEIEVKRHNGKQKDVQREWQQMIEELGGVYWLVRSESELADLLIKVNPSLTYF